MQKVKGILMSNFNIDTKNSIYYEYVKPKNSKSKKMIPGNTIFIEKSKIKESKLIISI